VTIKTPLRIKRKVETSNTINPSVPTVVTLNYREHPDTKESNILKEHSKGSDRGKSNILEENTLHASSTTKPSSKYSKQYTPPIPTIVTSTTNNTILEEKPSVGRHRVAPSTASSVS
jgi:hypothetical protein